MELETCIIRIDIRIEDCFDIDGLRTPQNLTSLVTEQGGLLSINRFVDLSILEEKLDEGIDTILLFTKDNKPFQVVLFSQCNY